MGDTRRIRPEDIQGDYIISVTSKKNKFQKCYIPAALRPFLDGFNGFEKVSLRAISRRMKKHAKGWTFHDLRRTHAQLLRDADSGLIFAQQSLGHSRSSTTEGFYATSRNILIERVFTPILELLQ